jgi:Na+/H+ antiporter NhaD/arsenite permease-like protein
METIKKYLSTVLALLGAVLVFITDNIKPPPKISFPQYVGYEAVNTLYKLIGLLVILALVVPLNLFNKKSIFYLG